MTPVKGAVKVIMREDVTSVKLTDANRESDPAEPAGWSRGGVPGDGLLAIYWVKCSGHVDPD